jgi:hypothetical protein
VAPDPIPVRDVGPTVLSPGAASDLDMVSEEASRFNYRCKILSKSRLEVDPRRPVSSLGALTHASG